LAVADRQNPSTFTDEEKAYLDNQWRSKYGEDAWGSAHKLPVEKMNAALSILGVTAKDIKIPENWVFFDKTNSYYVCHRDAFGVVGVTVTQVVKETDGTVQVYWQTNQKHMNTTTGVIQSDGVKMVMTLQEKTDGTYLILSNLPVTPTMPPDVQIVGLSDANIRAFVEMYFAQRKGYLQGSVNTIACAVGPVTTDEAAHKAALAAANVTFADSSLTILTILSGDKMADIKLTETATYIVNGKTKREIIVHKLCVFPDPNTNVLILSADGYKEELTKFESASYLPY